jgi:hypothetical protein
MKIEQKLFIARKQASSFCALAKINGKKRLEVERRCRELEELNRTLLEEIRIAKDMAREADRKKAAEMGERIVAQNQLHHMTEKSNYNEGCLVLSKMRFNEQEKALEAARSGLISVVKAQRATDYALQTCQGAIGKIDMVLAKKL